MMKKVFSLLLSLSLLFPMVALAEGGKEDECKGVKLNTNVPFVWKCIEFGSGDAGEGKVNQIEAFPKLMGGLMNIVMTAALIIGFVMILVGGVMISMWWVAKRWTVSKWKNMILNVWIVIALIGLSGIILKLINPTFFT